MAKPKFTGEDRKRKLSPRKKYTSQGSGKRTRPKNKHKRRSFSKYRGQGR